jgi:predicted 3-demethylubiquinone-9 3-methyltransferase (glyoxalase superfamily)
MPTITPHLCFDTEAREAAEFYTSILPDSQVTNITTLHDTPSGDCDLVSFELAGQPFMGISAGPLFKFNPSVSFLLNFDPSRDNHARVHLDQLWEQLSEGGTALMPLDRYPFSERYGWIQDKYGLSWQLMLTNPEGEERPFIIPSLMFTGQVAGHAEEAIEFYCAVFKDSRRGLTTRYPKGMEPDQEGTLMFADFSLLGTWLAAMDSAHEHNFAFNEAISLLIPCKTQAEIDYYWEKLSADPQAEQCGWLKDKFGLSWQVWPTVIGEMMQTGTREQIDRLTRAFLPMKKFDLATLQRAYEGKVR